MCDSNNTSHTLQPDFASKIYLLLNMVIMFPFLKIINAITKIVSLYLEQSKVLMKENI